MQPNNIKDKFQEIWQNPKIRNTSIMLLTVPLLFILISGIKDRTDGIEASKHKKDEAVNSMEIFDSSAVADLDQLEFDAMREDFEKETKAQQKLIENERAASKKEFQELSKELIKTRNETEDLRRMVESLIKEKQRYQTNNNDSRRESRPNNQNGSHRPTTVMTPEIQNQPLQKRQTTILTQSNPVHGRAIRTVTQRKVREVSGKGQVEIKEVASNNSLSQIGNDPKQKATKSKPEKDQKTQKFYMPAGSIVSGTLLNGVDAPTNNASKSDPMPILLRVKKEAFTAQLLHHGCP